MPGVIVDGGRGRALVQERRPRFVNRATDQAAAVNRVVMLASRKPDQLVKNVIRPWGLREADLPVRRQGLEGARPCGLVLHGIDPFNAGKGFALVHALGQDAFDGPADDAAFGKDGEGLVLLHEVQQAFDPHPGVRLPAPPVQCVYRAVRADAPDRKLRPVAAFIRHREVAGHELVDVGQFVVALEPVSLEERAFVRLRVLLIKRRPVAGQRVRLNAS